MKDVFWLLKYKHHKLGLERSTIVVQETPYMTRYILHAGLFSLRLHRFHTGDGDRSLHSHPFSFITFPLMGYREQIEGDRIRYVHPYRLHFRSRDFIHRVHGSYKVHKLYFQGEPIFYESYGLPFWTIVLTGPYHDAWGFYDEYGNYTPYQEHEGAKE